MHRSESVYIALNVSTLQRIQQLSADAGDKIRIHLAATAAAAAADDDDDNVAQEERLHLHLHVDSCRSAKLAPKHVHL